MWIQCLSYMQNYHDGIRKSCKYVADNNILVENYQCFFSCWTYCEGRTPNSS